MSHEIKLVDVLPSVFAEQADRLPHVRDSRVWLNTVSFVTPGRYLVVAESGTGKSSLISFIYGNRHDYQGTILLDGEDISHFSPQKWCEVRRTRLALLPQEMRLFPELTVYENIDIKNRLTGYKTEGQINDMLQLLGIADKRDTPAALLSIGQQQRVAMIRALCQPFEFLLLDEPVSHLDDRNNETVASLVDEEAQRQGAAIITTSVGNHLAINNAEILKL